MEYLRYLAVLRRRALLIVVLTALGAGSAFAFATRQHTVYSATAKLLINPAAPSQAIPYLQSAVGAANGGATQQLASTYDVYLHSDSFQGKATRKLGLPTLGTLSTGLVGNTTFFNITAQAGSPLLAMRIANGVATVFIQENYDLQRAQQTAGQGGSTSQAAVLQRQITSVEALDARLSKLLGTSPSAAQLQVLAAVENRLSSLTTIYNQLLAQQGTLGSAQSLNTATLIDPAQVPAQPIAPNVRKDVLFGLVAGLFLGVLAAFLLNYLDYTMRSPEDVQDAMGQPPLAVIGMIGGRQGRDRRPTAGKAKAGVAARLPGEAVPLQAGASLPHQNGTAHASATIPAAPAALITIQSPHDPISEAFRNLRTNLAFSTLGKPARSLVVTSVVPGEGKSTVAANLAVVLAQSGKRMILVDTDLRRPSLHQVFHLRNTGGFTDLLLEGGDVTTYLQETAVPNLRVLTSGVLPPNPAELLSSDAVVPLIAALGAHADMVIFDTPPMGGLTDAVVLSTRVEGTLLVVRSGSGRPNVVAKGLEALKKVGARPLGVVLNMVDVSSLRDTSYYYYYAQSGDYGKTPHGTAAGPAGR